MTEDEAKTKACAGPRNYSDSGSEIHCVASACMAWRWTARTAVVMRKSYRTAAGVEPETVVGRGYCGLAGAAA